MSDPEKCLSLGKNFSRREWLMLIVILLMLEAAALIASHSFMSNQDVINYISFASTIASLLLAVLAIVYGFYQSESQKRVGDGVEGHLNSIRVATEIMTQASKDLNGHAQSIGSLEKSLGGLDDSIGSTKLMLGQLDESLRTISQEQGRVTAMVSEMHGNQSSRSETAVLKGDLYDAAKILLFNWPSVVGTYAAVALYAVFKNNPKAVYSTNDFIRAVAESLSANNLTQATVVEWNAGLSTALSFFRSVNLLKITIISETVIDISDIQLMPESMEILEKAVEKARNNNGVSIVVNKLEEGLKDFHLRNKAPA